ncbi:hypothetical protein ACVW0B_001748 [Thermostichus sp. MS-CIW-23]|jgi:hypothetical protein
MVSLQPLVQALPEAPRRIPASIWLQATQDLAQPIHHPWLPEQYRLYLYAALCCYRHHCRHQVNSPKGGHQRFDDLAG